MRDAEAVADVVVQTLKAALAPVAERIAAVETRIAVLGDVRDRVVGLEAKGAVVLPPPVVPPAIDLTPVLERLAAMEARVLALGDVRDRVLGLEAKRAQPIEPPVELPPPVVDLGEIRERLAVLETKAPVPGPAGPAGPLGPMGPPGIDGREGPEGKIGKDGVSLDDLSVDQEHERKWVIKGTVGTRVKEIGSVTVPVDIYRDVWVEGRTYDRGDSVTWAGSEWHCKDQTRTKPGESKDWTLKVKRGRDGKDGKDAPVHPVVSVGARHA